jgi:hypothetical protein
MTIDLSSCHPEFSYQFQTVIDQSSAGKVEKDYGPDSKNLSLRKGAVAAYK